MKIILGSKSPRRKEILNILKIPFETASIDCEENYPQTLKAKEIPLYIANLKAKSFNNLTKDDILITADTIVWCNDKMLGKPRDVEEAKYMLKLLSDNIHQVYTAVCIRNNDVITEFVDTTEVRFCKLSDKLIDEYIEEYNPLDKAGAYGIQDLIGYVGIDYIKGSYYNVMGLPINILYNYFNNKLMIL